jgi:SagB-type dehydrogenase family enzyme
LPVRELYRLRADAELTSQPDGAVLLRQTRFEVEIASPSPGRRAMLLRLAERWADDGEIGRVIASIEGERGILPGQVLLRRLTANSWLQRRLQSGDRPLIDVIPLALGAGRQPPSIKHEPQVSYRLSRFASVSSDGGSGLVARTPLATVAIGFVDTALAALLVPAASAGCAVAALAAMAKLDRQAAAAVLDQLLSARILISPDEYEAERSQPPKATWAPEELSLHDRARAGRHALPIGGTLRFTAVFPSEPLHRAGPERADRSEAVLADTGGEALPVPDLDLISAAEPSLTSVITARRSIREHDEASPITVGQLAEFLYRVQYTSRVRDTGDSQETGTRPYPTGGQLCDMEIYPLVSRCEGLDPGLYRYDSIAHRLVHLAKLHPSGQRMLVHARAAAMMTAAPQVLLVITSRVQRLLWKYEGMGYALALKNAGVLTGYMYLVATAMNLAPCALGSGDSDAFALLSGLDPLVEPSIADFAIGSRREATT